MVLDVVLPRSDVSCKVNAVLTPTIPESLLPSPIKNPEVVIISPVVVFPLSVTSWSVDAAAPLYFCILRPVLQLGILTNTSDYF